MQHVVPQILPEMEGFNSGKDTTKAMLFMGATNEPWSLDEAVLRPGRFDEKVYVPLPDFDARLAILYYHLKDKPLSPDISLEEITRMLEKAIVVRIYAVSVRKHVIYLLSSLSKREPKGI
jgi:SpoVK/Ycf46/Vps4 family AAA+-type ATPase